MDPRRLLLISNSTQYGLGYLDHVAEEIRDLLGRLRRVLFIPFAMFDRDAYAEKARIRLDAMGFELTSLHRATDPASAASAIAYAEAVFIGGGNTFRLLDSLQALDVMPALRARIGEGAPYIGSSAGSIVACPTLKTTKDMPIVEPRSFEALGLVSFQISPHFLDPDPGSRHMGETQEERILTFLEENDAPVVGLREGSFLRVAARSVVLKGPSPARLFARGRAPIEASPGSELSDLLAVPR